MGKVRNFDGTPITDSVRVGKLRLGHTVLQQQDGQWIGEQVYYLSEARALDEGVDIPYSRLFARDNLQTVRDRITNPEFYRLSPLPLHPHEYWDLLGDKGVNVDSIKTTTFALDEEPTFDIGKNYMLFKQTDPEDLIDIGLDPRTMRYAAMHLYPGVHVVVDYARGSASGRIKAVGFGISGPLGLLIHYQPLGFNDKQKRANILRSDIWIDASEAEIAVCDKRDPDRMLIRFNQLRSMTVPAHA